ncbi:uncharacterized protein PGTG_04750 [Puccinia graminis f. sp. tritici CRL 75-36-700-3]|uniref:Uncharacterized protein n=1 Tax=Puccinia graminis f. sp. tritici (strain CRL 75-36-700-3 / race SCCL) TaxID=418459 RepID=E3K3Z2_PUCGT|nr:uncharacterized protein PGTG_04750 [Puccinia graminis f. sp. tritici CRL 75-36-700-3]EFP78794.2 hypothetical protein PGTG_04750 [Puccinia graminis f. sp. tritici CRL 75-36-700-3]
MANTSYSNGRVPPLPFANSPEGLQESWLEPSLSADPNAEAFRLFHDNVCTESQFKNAYNQPTARSTGSESAPKPQLRAIYLDYHVYYQSVWNYPVGSDRVWKGKCAVNKAALR